MKIRIHVTKEILEKTKSCASMVSNCAVSEAVREIFPEAWTFTHGIHPFPVDTHDLGEGIPIPNEAIAFICAFDSRATDEERANLKPLSFDIDVPDSIIEKIGIHEVDRILSESKTLERA